MPTEISPWIERLRPHRVPIAIGTLLVVLAVALAWVAWRWGVAEDRMAMLQAQADAGFLQAPTSSRTLRIDLRNPGTTTIGGGEFPERVDFLLNARTARYARFRVSLLREDGTPKIEVGEDEALVLALAGQHDDVGERRQPGPHRQQRGDHPAHRGSPGPPARVARGFSLARGPGSFRIGRSLADPQIHANRYRRRDRRGRGARHNPRTVCPVRDAGGPGP